MSKIFPKLEELYVTIINEYYKSFKIILNESQKTLINKLFKPRTSLYDIVSILDTIKSFCESHCKQDKKYSDITSFTLNYINKMSEFFKEKELSNIEAKYLDNYCLAYISLVGFNCFNADLENDDELFKFKLEKYTIFSKFLIDNLNLEDLKNYYESYSLQIKNIFKNDNDKYMKLIIIFDPDYQFHKREIYEKQKIDETGPTKENKDLKKDINKNQLFQESINGNDSNITKDKYREKNSSNMNTGNDNSINCKLPNNYNKEIAEVDNHTKNQEDKIIEINKKNSDYLNNSLNESKIPPIIEERLQYLEFLIRTSSTINTLQTDFIDIKIQYQIYRESIFNSSYLKILEHKNKYLEAYIKSLQNIEINLSNPYNFNLWRKVSNIILKNIFIILIKKNYVIKLIKGKFIIKQIQSTTNKTIFDDKIKNQIIKIVEDLKIKSKDEILNRLFSSPAADKKLLYNLITIEKNNGADIIASLSIDFLFYLKELGNKFAYLDESILNYILFSDLSIIEEKDLEDEENKKGSKEIIIREINEGDKKMNDIIKQEPLKKIDIINDTIKNDVQINKSDNMENSNNIKNDISKNNEENISEKTNKIEKSKVIKKQNIKRINIIIKTKGNKTKSIMEKTNEVNNNDIKNCIVDEPKNNLIKENESKINKAYEEKKIIKQTNEKNKILKIEKFVLNNKKESEDKEKIKSKIKINVKEINEFKNFENNKISEEKTPNQKEENISGNNKNLIKKYEGKKIFYRTVIEILKNPVKFQRKNIIVEDLFDSIYEKIENVKKEINYEDSNIKLNKLVVLSKELESKCKELLTKIEKKAKNLFHIDIKNIEMNNERMKDFNIKELENTYLKLKKLYNEVKENINVYEENNKKYIKLNELISYNEIEVNNYINNIQVKIGKVAELSKISDVFEQYKYDLKNNIYEKKEYLEHSDIFNAKNIDEFKINDFYHFVEEILKDNN